MFRIFRIATLATLLGGYEILHIKKWENVWPSLSSRRIQTNISIYAFFTKKKIKEENRRERGG